MANEIHDIRISQLKKKFSEYLKAQGKKSPETTVSDAFYLYRKATHLDFIALLDIEEFNQFKSIANEKLRSILIEESSAKGKNTSTYSNAITQLWRYVHKSHNSYSLSPNTVVYTTPKTAYQIPRPSCEEVDKYLHKWNTNAELFQPEIVLKKLFTETCPRNNSINDIILKIAALNTVYNTYIYSVYPVARHILSLDIDNRLAKGDETLVDELMQVLYTNGKKINHYSFATKYCSFHNPNAFPIYDSYVDRILRYYREHEEFSVFKNNDLKIYPKFKQILFDFQHYFGLEKYNAKELDQYLWQFSKEFFPKMNR